MPIHLYLAPAASGKTTYLVAQARALNANLTATPRVVVPTQLQARAWQRRLAEGRERRRAGGARRHVRRALPRRPARRRRDLRPAHRTNPVPPAARAHRNRPARLLRPAPRGCGITDAAELQDAIRRAVRILTRFQTTDLYQQMATATRRLHEVPYSQLGPNGVVERGTFDALFLTEGQWTLVEFKTDYVGGPTKLEETLAREDYVAQVARYLDAAACLLGTRPRPVLCFLNYAGAVRLVTERW